jgi:hypothetical protein
MLSVCVRGVFMRLSENYTVFPTVENSCLNLEAVSVALQLRKLCFHLCAHSVSSRCYDDIGMNECA